MSDHDEFGLRRRPRRAAEINLINMIDMLFFLIVFFVITSSFTRETGVDISKPKAQTAKAMARQPLLVGVTKEGNIHVNESPVSPSALEGVLRHYTTLDPDRAVVIVADREAAMAGVVSVLDACNLAGVKSVSVSALRE